MNVLQIHRLVPLTLFLPSEQSYWRGWSTENSSCSCPGRPYPTEKAACPKDSPAQCHGSTKHSPGSSPGWWPPRHGPPEHCIPTDRSYRERKSCPSSDSTINLWMFCESDPVFYILHECVVGDAGCWHIWAGWEVLWKLFVQSQFYCSFQGGKFLQNYSSRSPLIREKVACFAGSVSELNHKTVQNIPWLRLWCGVIIRAALTSDTNPPIM